MGEELNLGKAFFCVTADIGTDKEKWHEAKLENVVTLKAADLLPQTRDESQRGNRKGFTNSFTLSFEVSEDTRKSIMHFQQKLHKRHSGFRYYCEKCIERASKKVIRQYLYEIRKLYHNKTNGSNRVKKIFRGREIYNRKRRMYPRHSFRI